MVLLLLVVVWGCETPCWFDADSEQGPTIGEIGLEMIGVLGHGAIF